VVVFYCSEGVYAVLRADGDEIQSRPGVVVAFQADGAAVVVSNDDIICHI